MGSLWLQLAHYMVVARPLQRTREYSQPMAPPGMVMMQREVITPNPDYPIPANLWDHCARAPSPLSTFIRHCNTMQSPHFPTYSKQGVQEPVADISDLNRSTSSIENLRELQKYCEKHSYESHMLSSMGRRHPDADQR